MRVVFIGTGNVATILGRAIHGAGHSIAGIYGRDTVKTGALTNLLQARENGPIDSITAEADMYILAVADSAIESVASHLPIHQKLLVHTAGSVSINVLQKAGRNYGVLYPLQSLRKERVDIPVIPFLVDGNTPDTLTIIKDLAASLSDKVVVASDAERMKLHLAAVIVGNFTNQLYTLTADFCEKNKLPFSVLFPLIEEVATRLKESPPQSFQTGPAIRRDQATIEKHVSLLEEYPEIKNLYAIFTESIQAYHKNKR